MLESGLQICPRVGLFKSRQLLVQLVQHIVKARQAVFMEWIANKLVIMNTLFLLYTADYLIYIVLVHP